MDAVIAFNPITNAVASFTDDLLILCQQVLRNFRSNIIEQDKAIKETFTKLQQCVEVCYHEICITEQVMKDQRNAISGTFLQHCIALHWLTSLSLDLVKDVEAKRSDEVVSLNIKLQALHELFLRVNEVVAERTDFPIPYSQAQEVYEIGGKKLHVPFHVAVVDDDPEGKFAKYFEVPQVYGCGETEPEALDMLNREVIFTYNDLKENRRETPEFAALRNFFNCVFDYEK